MDKFDQKILVLVPPTQIVDEIFLARGREGKNESRWIAKFASANIDETIAE